MAAIISPAALFLRIFLILFVAGPFLLIEWWSEKGFSLVYGAIAFALFAWFRLWKEIPLRPQPQADRVPEGRPVRGLAKLCALRVTDGASAIYSLTGPAAVVINPATRLPVLQDLGRPTRRRLLTEALTLVGLASLWIAGTYWATRVLDQELFLGLALLILGSGAALITLSERNGWAAGADHIEGAVWAAPLIHAEGPNRFRAMLALDGRILVRPDVLAAPYLPYLLAHEEAHRAARNNRLVWWEQLLCLLILMVNALCLRYLGLLGLLILLLLPLQRLLFSHLSYRSELAADAEAARRLGAERCLEALAILAVEGRPLTVPRWLRYSPTIQERIEHLQRFKARPGQS